MVGLKDNAWIQKTLRVGIKEVIIAKEAIGYAKDPETRIQKVIEYMKATERLKIFCKITEIDYQSIKKENHL